MVELDAMGAEAIALERSLRLLHRWNILHEDPEETWRREELVLEVEARYRRWLDIWRGFEEGEGEQQEGDDIRRLERASLRASMGHDTCVLCFR